MNDVWGRKGSGRIVTTSSTQKRDDTTTSPTKCIKDGQIVAQRILRRAF